MAIIGLAMMLVAFGFKVMQSIPLRSTWTLSVRVLQSQVSSTASKGMGFVALMRVLIGVTLIDDGSEWTILYLSGCSGDHDMG